MPPNRNHSLFNKASIQKSNMNVEETISITLITSAISISTMSIIFIKKRNNITTSYIWDHDHRSDSLADRHWNYSYCRTNLFVATTSIVMTHLKNVHEITETSKLSSNQNTIEVSNKRIIQEAALRKLIVEWIINRRYAFNEIEVKSFRKIFEYIDEALISKLPWSANIIRFDSFKYYKKCKLVITELLSTARSNIHLSFDISTSSNCKALLAIIAHWTSSIYKALTTLLAIKELNEDHIDENMVEIIYQVAKEYEILDKLDYFMMDNMFNNNTTLTELNLLI